MAEQVTFWIAAVLVTGSALMMITRRNPMASALWLMSALGGTAVLYLLLRATFLAAVQVIVYAGAILVLVLFVIMLLSLRPEELPKRRPLPYRLGATALALLFFGILAWGIVADPVFHREPDPEVALPSGIEPIGYALFESGGFAVPFEVASVLLLAGIVGAVVMGRRS